MSGITSVFTTKSHFLAASIVVVVAIAAPIFAEPKAPPPLRIGATLTLTGPASLWGHHAQQALQLAVDEVNAAGGVAGRQLELYVEDFGNMDLKKARSAAEHLLEVKKVEIVLPSFIEDCEVIVPRLTRLPMFSMAIGCGGMECAGVLGPYHTRATANDKALVDKLLDHAQKRHIEQLCIVSAEASYFLPYGHYARDSWKSRTGRAAKYESIPWDMDDLRPIASKFKAAGCDAVVSWIAIPQTASFLRRLREVGVHAPVYGPTYLDDPAITGPAGSALDGAIIAKQQAGTPEFIRLYQGKFGEHPNRPAATSYDAIKLLASLIPQVGTNAGALRNAVAATQNYSGASGTMSYLPDGERKSEAVELYERRGGESILLPD